MFGIIFTTVVMFGFAGLGSLSLVLAAKHPQQKEGFKAAVFFSFLLCACSGFVVLIVALSK